MAITLDNTLQGETSNSYADLAFADDYFANLPNSATNTKAVWWGLLGDGEKQQLLVLACWAIEKLKFTEPDTLTDVHLRYDNLNHRSYWDVPGDANTPVKSDPFQALQFPRNQDLRTDGTYFVPERVMMAQCEQAYYLGNEDFDAMAMAAQGVTRDSFKGGGVEMAQNLTRGGSTVCPLAKDLLATYILKRIKRFERA